MPLLLLMTVILPGANSSVDYVWAIPSVPITLNETIIEEVFPRPPTVKLSKSFLSRRLERGTTGVTTAGGAFFFVSFFIW